MKPKGEPMSQNLLLTGASSGIGAACATRLADRGFRVYGTSRAPKGPSPDERGIHWIAMDVCDDASVAKGVAEVLEREERIDALVCNAGFGIFGSAEEVSLEAAKSQLDTNFFGVLRTVRSVLPAMRAAGRGRIVLVSSLAARAPIPFQSHYSASKAAVGAFAFSLHNEVARFGIQVVVVEPGDINTPFNDAMDWGEPKTSAYGAAIAKTEAAIRESLPKSPGPEVVARVVERALTARRPSVRYAVGREALLVRIATRCLPDSVNLRLIRSHFGI
jgi:NAD(P)-dependent dehydrogenase (short-subunit alcohol dehydrogenase family)